MESKQQLSLIQNKPKKENSIPLRTIITIGLIFLSTFQIYIVINSPIFLRNKLVHEFLSVYYSVAQYQELFEGLAYEVKIYNVKQLSEQLCFTFSNIIEVDTIAFPDISYRDVKIKLIIQYNGDNAQQKQSIYQIHPQQGIVYPFNMKDIKSIQGFLLKVEMFELQFSNISYQSKGFKEKYKHKLRYHYEDQSLIRNDFQFDFDFSQLQFQKPQQTHGIYIRAYFVMMLLVSLFALYLNYKEITKVYNYLYKSLGLQGTANQQQQTEEGQELKSYIQKWVKSTKLTANEISFFVHLRVVEFDIVFSTLSNICQIIASCFLIVGAQQEILLGVACLFSWLTIFRIIKNQKDIVLMYELIKLSFFRIMLFFVQFLPIFIGYILLGICLFPKVSFYGSVDDAATTLVSMMAGDSIHMITNTMIEKNSTLLSTVYVFSFVMLFMHAIHSTLTSLVKQAYILKKIELVMHKKQKKNQQQYIYFDQIKTSIDQRKNQLPIRLTPQLQKEIVRDKSMRAIKKRKSLIQKVFSQYQKINLQEIWVAHDFQLYHSILYRKQLERRLLDLQRYQVPFHIQNESQLTDQ